VRKEAPEEGGIANKGVGSGREVVARKEKA
jgi:hypothetical protein